MGGRCCGVMASVRVEPADVWEHEFVCLADTGIDKRELVGTGLTPFDFEWGRTYPFHPDDRGDNMTVPPVYEREVVHTP